MSTCIAVWCILTLDGWWSEAVAIGSLAFVEKVKSELGIKALHRELEQGVGRMRCESKARLTTAIYCVKPSH